jgi:hypothetical protein
LYGWRRVPGSQEHWAQGARNDGEEDGGDMPEAVNEDDGGILDEPHDEEEREYSCDDDLGLPGWGMSWEQKKAIE